MDKIPIDLFDLGFYEGNWATFCDRSAIVEDYLYFPDHEAKKARLIVCSWVWEQRKFNKESVIACAVYKYCALMKSKVDQFLHQFIDTFSMNDTEKRQHLVGREKFDETTHCYQTSMDEFGKKCIAPGNAFHVMFKQIFARACTYEGLTTQTILSTIEEACEGKFMTDKVDWSLYCSTIPLKKVP